MNSANTTKVSPIKISPRVVWKDVWITLLAAASAGLAGALVLGLLVLSLTSPARADSVGAREGELPPWQADRLRQGGLLLRAVSGGTAAIDAPLLKTTVEIDVSGLLLRARVSQIFRNAGTDWVEGIYVFPLPESAAVDRLRMRYGKHVIDGEIQEKTRARKRYAEARREGRKASLVSQERPNIFTTEIANIAPGEQVRVEIEYQQTLRYEQGRFSFRFPMVLAPRYIPGAPLADDEVVRFSGSGWAANTTRVKDAERITPWVLDPTQGTVNPVDIRVNLNPGMPLAHVESPYHPITLSRDPRGIYQVKLADDKVVSERDFELTWSPQPAQAPYAALFTERWQEHDYAMLMVMPPIRQERVAPASTREVVFVLDRSGSMHGTSIVQAKAALATALQRLQPGDRFNIIHFNHHTQALFDRALPANAVSIRQALSNIRELEAEGGTEMLPALNLALRRPRREGVLRQVIFLTDGSVGNEEELFRAIARNLGPSRLFTVGIGSAPNGFFMSRAARFGRGSFVFVGDVSEVEEKVTSLFRKLENPALTDISVHWPSTMEMGIWPRRVPDLYLGEPILLALRAPILQGELTIEGTLDGRVWKLPVPLRRGADNPGVHGLWARRQIAALMDEQAGGRPATEVREAVLKVALEHRLVSRFTSLVAVDKTPVRPHDEPVQRQPVPVNLPSGWSASRVFGTLPQTATPAPRYLLLGLLSLGAGWWLRRRLIGRGARGVA